MSVLNKEFIFVIGAPRSGTSWLHRMIAAHPAVAGIEAELTLFSRYVAPQEAFYRKEREAMEAGKWRQGLPVLWDIERFRRHQRGFLEAAYSDVLATRPGATHILDKHPNYANHMPLIAAYLPQARFIHLLRDGRSVAVSMMSVRRRVGHSPGEIRGAAQEWKRNVEGARHAAEALSGRCLEVRYEDLRVRTSAGLKAIYAHCGLPADDALLARVVAENDIRTKPVSSGEAAVSGMDSVDWRAHLSLRERYLFDRIAGDLLVESGYAQQGWWAMRPLDRVTMALATPIVRARRALHIAWSAARAPLSQHLELLRR